MMTPTSERSARAGEWLRELHGLALGLLGRSPAPPGTACTGAYVDLTFAFGFARIGRTAECQELLSHAASDLADRGELHAALLAAYRYRIEQALAGEHVGGGLPVEWMAQIRLIEPSAHEPPLQGRYSIDRLRQR